MKIYSILALLAFSTLAHAAAESGARTEGASPQSAEVTDGTWNSYCVYQNGEVRFIFLSKHRFTLSKLGGPESGGLTFDRGNSVIRSIGFTPTEKDGDLLEVSTP